MADWQGDFAGAVALAQQSLVLQRGLDDKAAIAYTLENLGTAQLFGVAAALRTAIGAPLPPSDRIVYAQRVSTLRDPLGEPTFAAAWADGQTLPLEQAVVLALVEAEKALNA